MSDHRITRVGAQRLGHDYQDLVALDVLVDWLGHSDRYQWIKVEADEAGYLDDVIALRSDNRLIVKQVKFSNHPDAYNDSLTWNDLLQKASERSASLLEKWSRSLKELLRSWEIEEASLVTNRRPSAELEQALRSNEQIIDFDAIEPNEVKNDIINQLGTELHAREFFQLFRFRLNQPNLSEREDALRRRFINELKGTESGWQSLRERLRSWVAFKDRPRTDGFIYLEDIRAAALWNILDELPQEFQLPDDYIVPSKDFHREVLDKVLEQDTKCLVITANPGVGKSSYCSYLYQQLRNDKHFVIRHHYYLSTSDRYGSPRLEFERAASSLLHDLIREHKDSLGAQADTNPSPGELRKYLEISGLHYSKRSEKLIVIVDGLDHVWRERDSIEELRRLLDQLLPVPGGITVLMALQPVDDSLLPTSLLRNAPRKQWLSLNTLNAEDVDKWFEHHIHQLPHFNGEVPDHLFREISDAFFQQSIGHPLYLQYALRALSLDSEPITTERILNLPGCPHEDINQYYGELWRRLNESSRAILHLFATCPFFWPEHGILDCLRRQGVSQPESVMALKQVEHLLKREPLGWQPFHSSLLVFVRNLPEHQQYDAQQTQVVLGWLDSSAPEYLKWGHRWLLQAKIGDTSNLTSRTTREWAVDAFAKRRSRQAIADILTMSLQYAVKEGKLARAFEVGLLYDHSFFHNNYDFDREVYEILLFPQLVLKDDDYLHLRLQNDLFELNNGEIAVLAEASLDLPNSPQIIRRCNRELNERLRRPPERGSSSWQSLFYPLLKVVSFPGGPIPFRVLDFAANNRDRGYTQEMLWAYGRYLWVYANTNFIRLATGATADDLELELLPSEQSIIQQFAVLHALENGLDLDDVLCLDDKVSPFVAIYQVMRGNTENTQFPGFDFAQEHLLSSRRYERFDISPPIWTLYYDAFFAFLANHLIGRKSHNDNWLSEIGNHSWHRRFLAHLNSISGSLSTTILRRESFSLQWFYNQIDLMERPRLYPNHDDFHFVEAANAAVERIGFDCIALMTSLTQQGSHISRNDLEYIFTSPYCYSHRWLKYFTELRRKWLSQDALDWLLSTQESALSEQIEVFPERAEQYAVLASVAIVHNDLDNARRLVRLVADNMISHGEHKDMLFFQVIESIAAYHNALPEEHQDQEFSRKCLLKIAPAITYVEHYTDGDETGGLPRELADTLAQVAPDLLPAYYMWLTEQEDYYDASHVFHVFIKTADLSNLLNQAIAKTAVDEQSFLILKNRATGGDEGAKVVLSELLSYFGERVLEQYNEDSPSSSSSFSPSTKPLPNPAEYEPEKLSDYLTMLREHALFWDDGPMIQWIAHWSNAGRKHDAYQAIKTYVDNGGRFHNFDVVFDLALSLYGKSEAYRWLVNAHIEDSGWTRYFARKERAVRRWGIIKKFYPERWFEFIQDTVIRKRPGTGTWYLDPLAFVRIIEFCLFMDQHKLVRELVQTIVDSSLEYVPVNLSQAEWVTKNEC